MKKRKEDIYKLPDHSRFHQELIQKENSSINVWDVGNLYKQPAQDKTSIKFSNNKNKNKNKNIEIKLKTQTWPLSWMISKSLSSEIVSVLTSNESKGSKSRMKQSSVSSNFFMSCLVFRQNMPLRGVSSSFKDGFVVLAFVSIFLFQTAEIENTNEWKT